MNNKRIIFLTSLFFFLFGFLFLFKFSSPVYALSCTWGCKRYGNCQAVYGTCYRACSPCKKYDDRCCRLVGQCIAECCEEWSRCPYSCVTGWNCECVECNPEPPDPCKPPCASGDSDGDGVCNACDPCPNDKDNNCGGGCGSSSDCPPGYTCSGGTCVGGPGGGGCQTDADCPADYECVDGSCNVLCNKTGSGTHCNTNLPNNGCPAGEMCCWGSGECYVACCGGGGPTPDTTKPKCGVEIEPRMTGGNLVQNGDFEKKITNGWTVVSGNPGRQEKDSQNQWVKGDYSLWGADYQIRQDVSVTKGKLYRLIIFAKANFYKQGPEEEWDWGIAKLELDPYPASGSSTEWTEIVRGEDQTSWKKFEMTGYARDNTMTLLLWATEGGQGWYHNVGFDEISLREIAGADDVPTRDVNLKIGVWDNRHIGGRKIQKADGSWPETWTDFSYEKSADSISHKLVEFEDGWGLGVAVNDYGGNIGICASGVVKVGNPPECSLLSIPTSITQGETINISANASDTDGSVAKVEFYYVSYPQSDYCAAAWTKIGEDTNGADGWGVSWNTTGIAEGNYSVKADVYDDQGYWCTGNLDKCEADSACSDCRQVVNISSHIEAWFQTQDGNVHAGGSINSGIPEAATEKYFCLNGSGGYPGVVSYNGSSADFTPAGSVSAPPAEWLAKTSSSRKSYNYFYQLLGSPTLETPPPEIKNEDLPLTDQVKAFSGDVQTGNEWQLGTKRIVIITNGKFLIKHRIVIDSGGSLVVIAQGGIGISKNLIATGTGGNRLQGIFITDGTFYSSVEEDFSLTPAGSDKILVIDGMVIAQSVNLGRDFSGSLEYDNNTTPAEAFRYDPSLFMNLHPDLWRASHTWEELAP